MEREGEAIVIEEEQEEEEVIGEIARGTFLKMPFSSLRRERILPQSKRKAPESPEIDPTHLKKAKTSEYTSPTEYSFFSLLVSASSNLSPCSRCLEYPGRFLAAEQNSLDQEELRCKICRAVVDHKRKDSVEKHLISKKHLELEKEKESAVLSNATLFDFGAARPNIPVGSGSSLTPDHQNWRLAVLNTFLKAGVPIAKIDEFRSLLELHAPLSLTHSSHMAKMIPAVLKSMNATTAALIKNRYVVILFDGTPHIGEVVSIVVRFWNGRLRQRLLSFIHLDKSPSAVELYRVNFPFLLHHSLYLIF